MKIMTYLALIATANAVSLNSTESTKMVNIDPLIRDIFLKYLPSLAAKAIGKKNPMIPAVLLGFNKWVGTLQQGLEAAGFKNVIMNDDL